MKFKIKNIRIGDILMFNDGDMEVTGIEYRSELIHVRDSIADTHSYSFKDVLSNCAGIKK